MMKVISRAVKARFLSQVTNGLAYTASRTTCLSAEGFTIHTQKICVRAVPAGFRRI